MSDDVDRTRMAAEELREYARGELEEAPHSDLSRAAGLVRDDDVRDMLVFAEQAYSRHSDVDDPDFWSTNWAEDRLSRAASRTASTAVQRGNVSQMAYFRGWVEYESDVSGLHAVRRLENWLCMSEAAKLVYLMGHMGDGKTDFNVTCFQVVNHFWSRVEETTPDEVETPEVKFAANARVKTPDGAPTVRNIRDYDALMEWVEGHDSSDELWYMFDESSTHLTAQSGKNAQTVAEIMGPFVKRMRKKGCNMVVIGHDGRDVAPAIRVLCDVVAKTGKKTASFYKTIQNREPSGHLFDLDGIPPTSWEIDTDDMADWSWGSALDDVEQDVDGVVVDETQLKRMAAIRGAEIYERVDDVTLSDAVDMVSTESVSISRRMLDAARDGKYQDVQPA